MEIQHNIPSSAIAVLKRELPEVLEQYGYETAIDEFASKLEHYFYNRNDAIEFIENLIETLD